MNLLINMLQ